MRMTRATTLARTMAVLAVLWMQPAFAHVQQGEAAGLPRSDLPLALVSFNVGVEIGQLGFIVLVLALERSFRLLEVRWSRWARALPGYVVGTLGAFWTVQRLMVMVGGA